MPRSCVLLAILFIVFSTQAAADEFTDNKQKQIESCAAIPKSAASTWLIFNPSDLQTVNHRSRCFQNLAIAERDYYLCKRVIEKKSLFLDGSGISPERCRQRVTRRREQDLQKFKQENYQELHRLTSLEFKKNGNGRDYDLIIETTGKMAGKYQLVLDLIFPNSRHITVLEEKTSYGANNSKRYLLLRAADISKKLTDPNLQKTYPWLAHFSLVKDNENRFIYDRIPADLVQSSLPVTINFSALPPWSPEPNTQEAPNVR